MIFIESNHSYTNNVGEKYAGVTSLIKEFEPKKDWDEIARKFAKKNKKTVEEVQELWKEEGRKAIEKGIKYHLKKEQEYASKGSVEIDGKNYDVVFCPIIDGVKHAIDLKLEEKIYPELIIYSDRYKVAGQADLVEVRDGKIHITDYKTSKEIKLESYKNWKGVHEMMLFPVSHLMNCNFSIYSLQLNMYMYILKSHNRKLKIGDMKIHHIIIKEDMITGEETEELVVHDVPDLQKEVKTILEHHYHQTNYVF